MRHLRAVRQRYGDAGRSVQPRSCIGPILFSAIAARIPRLGRGAFAKRLAAQQQQQEQEQQAAAQAAAAAAVAAAGLEPPVLPPAQAVGVQNVYDAAPDDVASTGDATQEVTVDVPLTTSSQPDTPASLPGSVGDTPSSAAGAGSGDEASEPPAAQVAGGPPASGSTASSRAAASLAQVRRQSLRRSAGSLGCAWRHGIAWNRSCRA